jgi:hypothetical protein
VRCGDGATIWRNPGEVESLGPTTELGEVTAELVCAAVPGQTLLVVAQWVDCDRSVSCDAMSCEGHLQLNPSKILPDEASTSVGATVAAGVRSTRFCCSCWVSGIRLAVAGMSEEGVAYLLPRWPCACWSYEEASSLCGGRGSFVDGCYLAETGRSSIVKERREGRRKA